ncbi:hypothetical protein, partial [Empedobacter falsenii]|uniref:hypothetical protein n=1 Tax=Empedobacter falsenii TaxID=343874 RepID=UPI00056F2ECC
MPALADNRVQWQTSRRFSGDAKIGQLARFIQAQRQEDQAAVLDRLEQQIVAASALQPVVLSADMPDRIQLEYLAGQHGEEIEPVYQKLMYG